MKKILGKKIQPIKKKRLSVRMPQSMVCDIEKNLIHNKLSIKQRSKWIADAIHDLYKNTCFLDLVAEEWIEPGGNTVLQITLDQNSETLLNEMNKVITKNLPNNDISSIVRTAIIQKLML